MAEDIVDLEPRYKARLAWDLLGHDEVLSWLPKLGLVPPSSEGLDLDHVDCHKRAARVEPLLPLISAFASLASEIHAAYTVGEAAALIPPGELEETEEMYGDIVFGLLQSGTLAIVAELMQEGILDYGPSVERV